MYNNFESTDPEALLERHGIRVTSNRLIVLKALMNSCRPMTMLELTDEIATIDKSNVFRTLMTFREHGLVHTVEACDNGIMYELCRSRSRESDDDIHPHFHCAICHRVFCLKGLSVPKLDYPAGFDVMEESFVVSGVCPDCKGRH